MPDCPVSLGKTRIDFTANISVILRIDSCCFQSDMGFLRIVASIALLTMMFAGVTAQTTLSYFSWDTSTDEKVADIGPNASSSSTTANCFGPPSVSGMACSPGQACAICNTVCYKNIALVVPNSPSGYFDQPDMEFTMHYRRVANTCSAGGSNLEAVGWFFRRGDDFWFGFQNGGKLSYRFRVVSPTTPFYTDIPGTTPAVNECWNCTGLTNATIPGDGAWHEYTFRYVSSLGFAYILIDGVVNYIDSSATPGAQMYWASSSVGFTIGDLMDGIGTNTPILDNATIGTPTPLPVTLSYFTAEKVQHSVILNWETLSEISNDFWTVLRSRDGSSWEEIGFLPGGGTLPEGKKYEFVDPNPMTGTNMYWLKQNDLNGQQHAFQAVAIFFSNNGSSIFAVFPNPVVQPGGELTIEINSAAASPAIIRIFDQSGRLVNETSEITEEGINYLKVGIEELPRGFYYIRMQAGGRTHSDKFMVLD